MAHGEFRQLPEVPTFILKLQQVLHACRKDIIFRGNN
jgi:hypothetical protein